MIRWINHRLGTAPATSSDIAPDIARVDVRDLVDKFGNSSDAVRGKIDEGVALLSSGRRVVVCCDYGISRSNAVAAGILARFEGILFSDAVHRVVQATREREIKLEPLNAVRAALGLTSGSRTIGQRPRVLLTGGSGFIGKHLQTALTGKTDLLISVGSEVDLIAGALGLDLLVQEHGIDQIIHLANPRVYTSNRAVGDTLSMLRNVLDVCRSTSARLIYLSCWEVYSGYRSPEVVADENLPMRPKGPYGETKFLCENLLAHHRSMHGLDCTIVRSATVYGEESDKPKFLYNFIRRAIEGAETIRAHRYSNGLPKLDLLHVEDLSRLVASVAVDRPIGDFNVGGGRLYSPAEIAELINAQCMGNSRIELQDVQDSVGNIRMDTNRAAALLGWQPMRSLEDTLGELIMMEKKETTP